MGARKNQLIAPTLRSWLTVAFFLGWLGVAHLPSLWGYEFTERFHRMQQIQDLPVPAGWDSLLGASFWTSARSYVRDPAPTLKPFAIRFYHQGMLAIARHLPPWSPGFFTARHVLIPPGDWLFYTPDFESCLSPAQIDALDKSIRLSAEKFHRAGKKIILIIIPDKGTIRNDKLGSFYHQLSRCGETSISSLLSKLGDHTPDGLIIKDISPILRSSIHDDGAFLVTDTHWASLTRLRAAQFLANAVDPGIFLDSDIEPAGEQLYQTDLANNSLNLDYAEPVQFFRTKLRPLSAEKYIVDNSGWPTITYRNSHDTNQRAIKPRTLMIGDSFLFSIADDLSPYFQEATWVHFAKQDRAYFPQLVAQSDVIIYAPVERFFLESGLRFFTKLLDAPAE